ncbi:hypothetical protein EGW08_004516, partial [Elysia chlorotica]
HLYLGCFFHALVLWDSVSHHNGFKHRVVNAGDGWPGEDTMSANGIDFHCTSFQDMADGSTGISHIIYQDRNSVFDITNQYHSCNFIGFLSLLMDKGKVHIEPICY